MNERITGKCTSLPEAKRCRLTGLGMRGECPKCGKTTERDFYDNYFSYGCVRDTYLVCSDYENCGHEWSVDLEVEIILRIKK
jgi:hypothetical protein